MHRHDPDSSWQRTSNQQSFNRGQGANMSDSPKNPGLDGRARDKDGQIDHKHPTTKIKHLREHYGKHFAPDRDGERTLGELLKESKFESLSQYVKHHGHHPAS
jgi:ribosomal protein S15P/S13E